MSVRIVGVPLLRTLPILNLVCAKSRLAFDRLTWQGLGNASIHVCLMLMVAYAVCIAAYGIGRPELRQNLAFFA